MPELLTGSSIAYCSADCSKEVDKSFLLVYENLYTLTRAKNIAIVKCTRQMHN